MARVVPSQIVEAIDRLFPHAAAAKQVAGGGMHLKNKHLPQLHGLALLMHDVPDELLTIGHQDYADFVLARGYIDIYLARWHTHGGEEFIPLVGDYDLATALRRILVQCSDEVPSPKTVDLAFISDASLRDSIRRDISAANHALLGGEWKAATVLAGAAIEALLLWGMQQLSTQLQMAAAITAAVKRGELSRQPHNSLERWDLHQFTVVAAELRLIKPETKTATMLAKDFRNLIHPGRSARLGQVCDRATALSALAALEHVVRDLS